MAAIHYVKNGAWWNGSPIETEAGLVFNPTHEQLVEAGWTPEEEEQVENDPTVAKSVAQFRAEICKEAEDYYRSTVVSSVDIKDTGEKYWLSADERVKAVIHIESILSIDSNKVLEHLTDDLNILDMMNKYAYECYVVFKEHILNISSMDNQAELERYDYTVGYPKRITIDRKLI